MKTVYEVEQFLRECLAKKKVECGVEIRYLSDEVNRTIIVEAYDVARKIEVSIFDSSCLENMRMDVIARMERVAGKCKLPFIKLDPVGKNSAYPESCEGDEIRGRLCHDVSIVIDREIEAAKALQTAK